jgi:hypothetical protein
MSQPDSQSQLPLQVQALLNRLQVRLGSGMAEVAASLLTVAEEAPGRLGREWELFWQEVAMESERLARGDGDMPDPTQDLSSERGSPPDGTTASDDAVPLSSFAAAGGQQPSGAPVPSSTDPQDLIDSLRARVAALSHKLDA